MKASDFEKEIGMLEVSVRVVPDPRCGERLCAIHATEKRLLPLIQRLHAALVEADKQGWQPIETAPNDEAILVVRDDGEVHLVTADDNDYTWSPYDGENQNHHGISKPTHWMSLPPPPTT
jgi:hypothetical protein